MYPKSKKPQTHFSNFVINLFYLYNNNLNIVKNY